MRIHNIYADENGETHFRDIEIELSEAGPDGTTSKKFPADRDHISHHPGGLVFRLAPCYSAAICDQFGCASQGHGQRRRHKNHGVGEIFLIEDLHGKGHLSQALGKLRHSVMIPID